MDGAQTRDADAGSLTVSLTVSLTMPFEGDRLGDGGEYAVPAAAVPAEVARAHAQPQDGTAKRRLLRIRSVAAKLAADAIEESYADALRTRRGGGDIGRSSDDDDDGEEEEKDAETEAGAGESLTRARRRDASDESDAHMLQENITRVEASLFEIGRLVSALDGMLAVSGSPSPGGTVADEQHAPRIHIERRAGSATLPRPSSSPSAAMPRAVKVALMRKSRAFRTAGARLTAGARRLRAQRVARDASYMRDLRSLRAAGATLRAVARGAAGTGGVEVWTHLHATRWTRVWPHLQRDDADDGDDDDGEPARMATRERKRAGGLTCRAAVQIPPAVDREAVLYVCGQRVPRSPPPPLLPGALSARREGAGRRWGGRRGDEEQREAEAAMAMADSNRDDGQWRRVGTIVGPQRIVRAARAYARERWRADTYDALGRAAITCAGIGGAASSDAAARLASNTMLWTLADASWDGFSVRFAGDSAASPPLLQVRFHAVADGDDCGAPSSAATTAPRAFEERILRGALPLRGVCEHLARVVVLADVERALTAVCAPLGLAPPWRQREGKRDGAMRAQWRLRVTQASEGHGAGGDGGNGGESDECGGDGDVVAEVFVVHGKVWASELGDGGGGTTRVQVPVAHLDAFVTRALVRYWLLRIRERVQQQQRQRQRREEAAAAEGDARGNEAASTAWRSDMHAVIDGGTVFIRRDAVEARASDDGQRCASSSWGQTAFVARVTLSISSSTTSAATTTTTVDDDRAKERAQRRAPPSASLSSSGERRWVEIGVHGRVWARLAAHEPHAIARVIARTDFITPPPSASSS